jgi:cytochrome c biogenesis protein CcmG/thiol:disulfide interchange protein DsbE
VNRWLMALPPVLFLALALALWQGMQRGDPANLPSVFIGRQAPDVPGPGLGETAILRNEDLRAGEVTLVNFWASWCPPCRAEHPMLKKMAADGIRIAGINMLDREADALKYLGGDGNPFFALGFDPAGRTRIEWGVSAPPETFILRGDGTIAYRFAGPLVGSDFEQRFLPELEKALGTAYRP